MCVCESLYQLITEHFGASDKESQLTGQNVKNVKNILGIQSFYLKRTSWKMLASIWYGLCISILRVKCVNVCNIYPFNPL